ncbi:MAG: DUF1553 domain-containing protein [Planctomycetaceae bacterium]|nr:DUF1553 domain-containing protein [Planctomycetaceae bacterium]
MLNYPCYHTASVAIGVVISLTSILSAEVVDFNRQIRPILSEHCFKCHGPDAAERQAELRLDTRKGLLGRKGDERIVVPEHPEMSELFRRLTSTDPDERMPPPDSKLELTDQQVQSIRTWIEQGAPWQQHWAFNLPHRSPLPAVKQNEWQTNPIDAFVASRLTREGLEPSPETSRATLIRRVTLDLTGLPPTPEEVADFLADASTNAYDRLVDRLLQTPAYGERMAVAWLDAARYADTSGYQNDGPRHMWRWRDWVIDAYNSGMPFDQFTREQLAGDLLPNATLDQRIATGFNRNHRGNAEGGVIAEEFQVEYVVDRVETTGTVWLGLTIGCARCHDHKYDPLSQQEFYELFAFFNNVPENGRAVKEGNSPPYIKAPTAEQRRTLEALDTRLAAAESAFTAQHSDLRMLQTEWEARQRADQASIRWNIDRGIAARFSFDATDDDVTVTFRDGEADYRGGVQGQAGNFDGRRFVDAGDVANFGYFDSFSIAAWIYPSASNAGTIVSRMTDAEEADGYYLQMQDGHIHVNLVKRWLDDCIRVETEPVVEPNEWTHVLVTYDGSRVAKGISVYLNGERVPLKVNYDFINQSFAATEPLRIGGGGGADGRFRGMIDEVQIFGRCLSAREAEIASVKQSIDEIAALDESQRTVKQQQKLDAYFLLHAAPEALREQNAELVALREERLRVSDSIPTVMIMEDSEPRTTHVLRRGEYDKLGEQVAPGVPAILSVSVHPNYHSRLDLANWLTDPTNPLTARVAVNRYWQAYFGVGLVKTSEDFGTQGERPSHPELLDWLATEFIRSGWDVKALQRLIVTSATYRQASRLTPELLARDPDNRLLARGPRIRLAAESVRDQALAAAKLLTARIGGPSVMPYQPQDLWKDIATDVNYEQSHGADLYRRSMYTYWKRTVVPPAMSAFDGADRESCRVLPQRTNTPLQALTLMNDVTFVEAARVIAQQAIAGSPSPEERLAHIFRAVVSREPTEREAAVLGQGLADHLAHFQSDPVAAERLVTVGEYPYPLSQEHAELAAYTTIASMVLNLDEAVTKQ